MTRRMCNKTHPARLICGAVLVLAVSLALVGQACAESLPPYPGISFPSGAFNSRCAQLSLSAGPTVVEVGQKITATAGPRTDACGGPASEVSYSWDFFGIGKTVSGCGPNASRCVVLAQVPTTGFWEQACIAGSSPFGAWSSCGLIYVLDHRFEVSGTVTAAGAGGQGLPGVKLKAACPSGGTTTTDASGDYNFVLDRGNCTISVVAPSGETAAPVQQQLFIDHDIKNVNFTLSCGTGGQAGDIAGAAVAGNSGSGCLHVEITVQRSATAGIGWRRTPPPAVPAFMAPVSSVIFGKTTEEHCLQGCVNVEVKVTTTKGKLVPGANVTLSVTRFPANSIASYRDGFGSGDGHLCDENIASSCNADALTVATGTTAPGGLGVAQFLYWAPGVVRKQSVTFTATAIAPCDSETSCPSASGGQLHGTAKPKLLTVAPNFVYTSPLAFFSAAQVQVLEDWAENPANFEGILGGDTAIGQRDHAVLAAAVKGAVGLVELAGEGACPLCAEGILAAEAAQEVKATTNEYADLSTPDGVEQAISALFLDPLKLIPAGLGDVNADELNQTFLDEVAGENGLLRAFGLGLKNETRLGLFKHANEIQLQLVDVSYCSQGAVCGPDVTNTPGVEPFMLFVFRAYNSQSSQPIFANQLPDPWLTRVFVVPYDPYFFDEFQFHGNGPPPPTEAAKSPL
ncbi:MAG: hypothetical protein ACLP01_21845 [Solirubrobacteraceae bacterium]